MRKAATSKLLQEHFSCNDPHDLHSTVGWVTICNNRETTVWQFALAFARF